MYLHNEKPTFEKLIHNTFKATDIPDILIEKDYYVTFLLKRIVESLPDIVFKGGTSLTKCHHCIERFSEDIDISFSNGKKTSTEKQRKETNRAVRECCKNNDFGRCSLKGDFLSNRTFNSATIEYDSVLPNNRLETKVIVELSQLCAIYPTQQATASCYITDYLTSIGDQEAIDRYNLAPFPVMTQTLERTFLDKIFALCDYYLRNKVTRNSRHIYDLYCIYPKIRIDEIRDLANEIRFLRSRLESAPSAKPEYDINDLLQKITDEEYYKEDYKTLTQNLLFKEVSYEKAVSVIHQIIQDNLF